jgi:hypothetical protein
MPSAARQLAKLSTVLAVLFACYSGPLSDTRALVPRGRAWLAFFRSAAFGFLPISSCAGARFPEVGSADAKTLLPTHGPARGHIGDKVNVLCTCTCATSCARFSGTVGKRLTRALSSECARRRSRPLPTLYTRQSYSTRPWPHCICIAGIIALDHARALCSLFGCPSPHPDRR